MAGLSLRFVTNFIISAKINKSVANGR